MGRRLSCGGSLRCNAAAAAVFSVNKEMPESLLGNERPHL